MFDQTFHLKPSVLKLRGIVNSLHETLGIEHFTDEALYLGGIIYKLGICLVHTA